ncbi:hypothetical protein [Aliiglaciecola lipolytica]|uniref:hypothetical protein n=1 Tax=Aliiglaciecola lipolytica TaxID=477689 RepID=UPI001C09D045|nr:hypothetical protein [Aliiglaciecola lipolytica]MBU2877062.1 hypothetical protein [Aliiglaciecola lipolytica]
MDRENSPTEEQSVIGARFSLRLLITVSAAALLFVLSPEKDNVYSSAVEELNLLMSLDLPELLSETRDDALDNDPSTSQYLTHIESTLERHGLFMDKEEIGEYFLEVRDDAAPIIDEMLIEDINGYVVSKNAINVKKVKIDEVFEQGLALGAADGSPTINKRGETTPLKRQDGAPLKIERFYIFDYNQPSNFIIGTQNGKLSRHGTPTSKFELFEFYFSDGEIPSKVQVSGEKQIEFERDTVSIDLIKQIQNKPEYNVLVRQNGQDLLFLPKLKEVWNQIRTEYPTQARTILARKADLKERVLQVFGLSIPQVLISWAIPSITFTVSLYLYAHIQFLQSVIARNPKVSESPWIVLMPGRIPFAITTVVVLIIPGLSVISTVVNTWGTGGNIVQIVSIIAGIGSIVTLASALILIISIRSRY